MKLFSFVSIFLLLAGCQSVSAPVTTKANAKAIDKTADYFLSQGFKQITFLGDNDSPRFSEDGGEMIFLSRARGPHKGAQIYEMDLRRNRERRVTFHDGSDSSPSYVDSHTILYSSTTDEIKESPFLNKNYDKEHPPAELYMSDLFGNAIERLTLFAGFDGEATYVHAAKPYIIFASQRGGLTGIFRLDVKNKQVSFFEVEKGKENRFPTLSPDDKKIAWIEHDLASDKYALRMSLLLNKKSETLKEGEGQYRDLFWDPSENRLFYSILRKGDSRYQIEAYSIEKKCTQILFKGNDSLSQPVLSNEPKPKLAFTRSFQDKKQIYMVSLPDDLGPCLEPPVSPKLDK